LLGDEFDELGVLLMGLGVSDGLVDGGVTLMDLGVSDGLGDRFEYDTLGSALPRDLGLRWLRSIELRASTVSSAKIH